MLKIPKFSAPLTKAIRTTEGILVVAVNIAIGVASAIPTAHLSVKEAATLAVINNGALLAQRGLIKGIALLKLAGFTPLEPAVLGQAAGIASAITPLVGTTIGDVAADVAKTPSLATAEGQASTLVADAEAVLAPPAATPPAA